MSEEIKENSKMLGALASIVAIFGAVGVGAANSCVDEDGLVFFAKEEVEIKEVVDGKEEITGTLCFEDELDYEETKFYQVEEYKRVEDKGAFIRGEGQILDDILTHEIQKIGKITIKNVTEEDDMFLRIMEELNL